MPILGILASSRPAFELVGSYDSLATVTVPSGGLASITFAGIPSGYKHLQIRYIWQTSVGDNDLKTTVNGDTSAVYSFHNIQGTGSSATAYGIGSRNFMEFAYNYNISGTFSTSCFVGGVMDILDYASTNKNKTFRNLAGVDYNGGGRITLDSGLYQNSSTAISSITFVPVSGGNFVQHSSFALYGVK